MAQQHFAGVDAHKRSLTVAVVDQFGAAVDTASFDNSTVGLAQVLGWLTEIGAVVRVGVEGSAGHGRHLAERLVTTRGCVYVFLPSLTGIRHLAAP